MTPLPRPTALIAEDEAVLRDELRTRLALHWPELEIVAEATNGQVPPQRYRTGAAAKGALRFALRLLALDELEQRFAHRGKLGQATLRRMIEQDEAATRFFRVNVIA